MQRRQNKIEKLIKEVHRNTRQVHNSEQKILMVIEGLRDDVANTVSAKRLTTNGIKNSSKSVKSVFLAMKPVRQLRMK